MSAFFDEVEFGGGGGRDAVVGRGRRCIGETGRSGRCIGETGGSDLIVVLAFQGGWSGGAGVYGVLRFVGHRNWIEERDKRMERDKKEKKKP